MKIGFREADPGGRDAIGEITVQPDICRSNSELALEPLNEPRQVANLPLRKCLTIPIPNQADPDGLIVMGAPCWADDMSAGKLFNPAVSHVHLAIAKAIAIADQEVISKSLIPPREMLAVY